MNEQSLYKTEEKLKLSLRNTNVALPLIGAGGFLFLMRFLGVHMMDVFWPIIPLTPGLLLLWPVHNATDSRPIFSVAAFVGAVITAVAGLLFVMNLTNHFEAWAYSWTLLPIAATLGLMYAKRFDPEHGIHTKGYRFIRAMGFVFAALALFFEVIVWESFYPWLPVALIGLGICAWWQNRSR